MIKAVRAAVVSMVVLLLLCTIVSVQAQTPDMGQGNANVIAQNMDTSGDAIVQAWYYNQNGTPADHIQRTIPPLAAKVFDVSTTSIGEPWQGSMILSSDKELGSVANLLWDGGAYGDKSTAASYEGPSETSDVWYLPYVAVLPGREVGQISVQNADSGQVTVDIRYYYRSRRDPTAEISQSIQVGGSKHYDLGSPGGNVPDLPGLVGKSSWVGSAVVQARGGKQITVAYVNNGRDQAAAYVGAIQPAKTLIGPYVARSATFDGKLKWVQYHTIILQNPNDKATLVDVGFYGQRTDSLDKLFENLRIGPHQILRIDLQRGRDVPAGELDPLDWRPGDDVKWKGWVVVDSNRPICGVVLDTKPTKPLASLYRMIDRLEVLQQGSRAVYMPAAYRLQSGGKWALYSRLVVANLSSSGRAAVHFHFYDRQGNLDFSLTRRIPKGQVKYIETNRDLLNSLGDNWVGSVYVESTRPIAATVDTLWRKPARQSTYNAINEVPTP